MRAIIVGVAEVEIIPDTAGFAAALDAESDAAFGGFRKDAEAAGEDAGAGLRGGVRGEAGKLEGDLNEAGLASGLALRDGMKDGAHGVEADFAEAGVAGGASFRKGAKDEADKVADDVDKAAKDGGEKAAEDLDKAGKDGGDRLSKGVGSGLSKLANLASNTGLPIGGLSSKLDEAGKSMQDADHKSSGLGDSLDKLGGYALLGVGAAAVVAGAATVKMAEGMETADTKMASAEEQGAKFGKTVGDAFLSTGGKAEYSGKEMATAFAGVAGQMKATEGHALSAGESLKFMTAAGDLTTATQGNLASVTATVSQVMQTFQMHTGEAAHASDVLYSASNLTGVSVESLGQELSKVRGKLGDTAGSVGNLASLLVDMKEQGISGRGAMTGLSTGMNALLKGSQGVATATQQQNTAFAAMSPSLKALAKQYESGAITSEAFKEQTAKLSPEQAGLAESFTKASTAVQTAQLKYKEMGLTVFDAQGKFVGMGSIIEQLGPRFAKMNKEQQLAAATQLFSAGAAKQMTAVIEAGIPGYQKATAEVEKHGAAQRAAAAQSKTLHDEEKALGVMFDNVAVIVGQMLIPIVTKMVGEFVTASTFVLAHKAILIGLAAVITGVLGTAIAVFTVNKMVAFGQSFTKASGVVKSFASDVETAVSKVIAQFTAQEAATDRLAATTAEKSGQMELDFEGTGAAARTAEGEIGSAAAGGATAVEGEATAVGTADSAIEADNVAAGASFTAMLGPIAAVAAAVIALDDILPNGDRPENLLGGNQPGEKDKEGNEGHEEGPYKLKTHGGPTSAVEQEILKTLLAKGLTPQAAAGFVGNAAQESSLTPGDAGGGLYQMSGYPSGDAAGSAAQQTEKAFELAGPNVIAQMNKAKTPAEAAVILEKEWEKPAGSQPGESATTNNRPHREQAATEAAEHVKGVGATDKNTAAIDNNTKALGGTASTGTSASSASTKEKAAEAQERAESKAKKAEEAAQKAALDKLVKGQEKASSEWVSKMVGEETKASAARKAGIQQEIAEHKVFLATEIADEKKGMSEKQAAEKARNNQEVKAGEAGEKERTKLETAIAKGTGKELTTDLSKAHEGALKVIETRLKESHDSALKKLAASLEKTWEAGVKKLAEVTKREAYEASPAGKAAAWEKGNREQRELEAAEAATPEGKADAAAKAQEAKEAQEKLAAEESLKAQEKAEQEKIDAINRQATIETDIASDKAQEIGDATKVMLDKQAEVGLSGTAEIAAHLQTVADEVAAEQDKQINAAKLAQDETVGKGAVAEAEAAARTSKVEAEAKVKEAEAQKQLELAKATASATGAGVGMNIENLIIQGAGMSSAELVGELGWSLKTGSLPVAEPQPVPA